MTQNNVESIASVTRWPPAIQAALPKPSGARFYRCAFQVNPHHYAETFRGRPTSGDENAYLQALVDKSAELQIQVLALTDHNHVGATDALRALARAHGIHVIPGFELASSEGVHVLCLYPLQTPVATLDRFLGEFGIRDTDPSSKLSSKSFTEILATVREQGGISIAAHIT